MQLTTLTFNFPLHPGDIPAFRAAIVEVVGLGHFLFHNHDNSVPGQQAYHNDYPLIRFGVHGGRARITAMHTGADALLRHLLPVLPDTLYIAGRPCDATQYTLDNQRWDVQLLPEAQPVGIKKWVALNNANYADWKKLEHHPDARLQLLNRCLTGQLRMAAARLAPTLDSNTIHGEVLRLDNVKRIQWHKTQLIAFDAVVSTALALPYGIGLGRSTAFGFGELCDAHTYNLLTTRKHATQTHDTHAGA